MARLGNLSAVQLRRLRCAAQLLHRPRRQRPPGVVRHLVGVQAQVLSAAALAIRARTPGTTERAVTQARLAHRSIVLAWAMRGTLHLVVAEDHGVLVPLLNEPHVARSMRRLGQEGVGGDEAQRGVRLIRRMLEREGPLARAEIASLLSRRGIRTEGQAIAHLVWLAASDGTVCHGPDRDGERTFVLASDWLGQLGDAPDRDTVLADLAVRYLRSHGPARADDLAAWSGLRLTDARRAWNAIAARLQEVRTSAGPMWTLRSRGATGPPAGIARMLPAFDEYLLGWKDRGFAVPSEHWTKVNAGGGWLHPVVVHDGRAVATWALERKVRVRPFGRLPPAARRGIEIEAREVESF